MSLDTAFFIISIEGALISALMGALGFLYIADKKNMNRRLEKQDENISQLAKFMREQQKQITDIANKMNKTVELIGVNQENDREQMGFLRDLVLQAVKK